MTVSNDPISSRRNRLRYAVAVLSVIVTGLLWRSRWIAMPAFLKKYGGDSLWALMVFLGIGWIFRDWSTRQTAMAALLVSLTVEFSKLCHPAWLDAFRRTRAGALTIGSVYNWPHIPAYIVGIALGIGIEWLVRRRAARR